MQSVVSVLFARGDSVYKTLQNCDVWDSERDARKWQGGTPIVAHPPCRAWGRLRHFAKPRADEKDLALFAVEQIRKYGGVLEHPEASTLWAAAKLPKPGDRDQWGGWTLPVKQFWWGHEADKKTWLYICGVEPKDAPLIPLKLGYAPKVVATSKRGVGRRPEISKFDRERTPPCFAEWLCDLARRCKAPQRLSIANLSDGTQGER